MARLQAWRASGPAPARAAETEDRLRERALRSRRKLRDRASEAADRRGELEQLGAAIAQDMAAVRVDESRAQAAVAAVFDRAKKVLADRQAAMAKAIAERYAAEVEPLQSDLRVVRRYPTASPLRRCSTGERAGRCGCCARAPPPAVLRGLLPLLLHKPCCEDCCSSTSCVARAAAAAPPPAVLRGLLLLLHQLC